MNRDGKSVLVGAALLLILALAWWNHPRTHSSAIVSIETRGVETSPRASHRSDLPKPVAKAKRPRAALRLPTRQAIRREAQADPHATPPSLIEFAASLAPRLEAALHSDIEADRFFHELEKCVIATEGGAESARAVCLSTAQALAHSHPELSDPWKHLVQRADPKLVRLLPDEPPPLPHSSGS